MLQRRREAHGLAASAGAVVAPVLGRVEIIVSKKTKQETFSNTAHSDNSDLCRGIESVSNFVSVFTRA